MYGGVCSQGIQGCPAVIWHEHSDSTKIRGSVLPGEVIPLGAENLPIHIAPLPTDPKARKAMPAWTGVMLYFPGVWGEVAKVSVLGNAQHNPGEPLHWERGKSADQMDAAFRHMLDHSTGDKKDTDGAWHLAKAIWRLCAELQLTIEKEKA